MTPDQIFAAVAALLLQEGNPDFDRLRSGGYDDRYPVTVSACEYPPGPLEVEGKTVICGSVDVPENYEAPEGRRIGLQFIIFDAQTLSPAADPLVYLHGGPAGGTLQISEAVANRMFPKHRLTRDIITFDQRASKLSYGSVECTGSIADNALDLAKSEKANPEDTTVVYSLLADCVEEIRATGADLPAYNTENNARDVRALMSALGYPEYNIYGISYGTRLSLEVMRTIPEGVRSVTIDGVAGPDKPIFDEFLTPYVDVADKLVEQCAADPACAGAYPDLHATINAAFDRVGNDPIPAGRGAGPVGALELYTLAFGERNKWRTPHDITRFLPRIFSELAEGRSKTFDAVTAHLDDNPSLATALVQSSDLTEDDRALAIATLKMAAAMEDLSDGARDTLLQLQGDLLAPLSTLSIAEAFDRRMSEAVIHLPDPAASAPALLRDYALMRAGPVSRDALAKLVSDNFSGADEADLLSLVAAMSDADISRTWDIAAESLRPYRAMVAETLGMAIYQCQEAVPFNSMEGFDRLSAPYAERYPVFGIPAFRELIQGALSPCALFDPHPREGFHDRVRSDIPTLVLNGTLDVQTSMHWGADAAEGLTNSRNYIVPEAGHGTVAYQPCARDIAAAFVNDPTAELDVSCIADILPPFVLPDDPLPGE
ncbi:alpha/beta fold hydrolase [Pseudooceanicola sp. C21-150M6]|uniref:alpha/beta fold hydrolase n=1 Tax=Pseudooceanicola sp. C21-150M6 TaxID=3434355 RepID=UPI003D7F2DF3